MTPVEEAKKVLDRYFSAMRSQDWEKLRECFVNDEATSYIGTDEGELWVGWDTAEPFLKSQVERFERVVVNRKELKCRECAGKRVVVFVEEDEMMITSGKDRHDVMVRLSGVVEKRGKEWLISHIHRSIPTQSPVVTYDAHPAVWF